MYPYLVTNPFDQNLGGKFLGCARVPFCFNQQTFCNSFVLLLLMFGFCSSTLATHSFVSPRRFGWEVGGRFQAKMLGTKKI